MYQIMSKGKHPMYSKDMNYYDYLMKLRSIKEKIGPIQWNYPPNFSKYEFSS